VWKRTARSLGGITKLAGIFESKLILRSMITAVGITPVRCSRAAPNGSLPSGGCLNREASKLLRTAPRSKLQGDRLRPGLITSGKIVSARHSGPPRRLASSGISCDGHAGQIHVEVKVALWAVGPVSRAGGTACGVDQDAGSETLLRLIGVEHGHLV